MIIFRIALAIVWSVVLFVTVRAMLVMGTNGLDVFFTDFAHPWRAQFYSDFSAHVLLMATWAFWREKSKWVGLLMALACASGGALFSLAYIFVTTYRVSGDYRALLLGKHA